MGNEGLRKDLIERLEMSKKCSPAVLRIFDVLIMKLRCYLLFIEHLSYLGTYDRGALVGTTR